MKTAPLPVNISQATEEQLITKDIQIYGPPNAAVSG
jgi:hypothetical protein